MATDGQKTVRVRVYGRVQGVGFRYFTQREADRLQLTGWVRNREDSSVEVLAQGAPAQLTQFIEKLRRGPSFAFVSRIDTTEQENAPDFAAFRITF